MSRNSLPSDFPAEISIAFQEGQYKGCTSYWAHFEHGGKHYKLVMTRSAYPRPCDMRIVYPQFSPNGHIVFVALYKPFSDEDVWSNYEHDDAAYDDFREHQEELQWERMEERDRH